MGPPSLLLIRRISFSPALILYSVLAKSSVRAVEATEGRGVIWKDGDLLDSAPILTNSSTAQDVVSIQWPNHQVYMKLRVLQGAAHSRLALNPSPTFHLPRHRPSHQSLASLLLIVAPSNHSEPIYGEWPRPRWSWRPCCEDQLGVLPPQAWLLPDGPLQGEPEGRGEWPDWVVARRCGEGSLARLGLPLAPASIHPPIVLGKVKPPRRMMISTTQTCSDRSMGNLLDLTSPEERGVPPIDMDLY